MSGLLHESRQFECKISGKIFESEESMKPNIGSIDRAVRILLGLILISTVFVGPKMAWGWIGILPLATGLIGFCPIYALLGINTCSVKH